MVVATRFELATPTMSRWCSNQLSYATIIELFLQSNEVPDHKLRGGLPYPKAA